jgi:hypothetical protein
LNNSINTPQKRDPKELTIQPLSDFIAIYQNKESMEMIENAISKNMEALVEEMEEIGCEVDGEYRVPEIKNCVGSPLR